jgi:hypothetical protein
MNLLQPLLFFAMTQSLAVKEKGEGDGLTCFCQKWYAFSAHFPDKGDRIDEAALPI